jgi:hypothetical protein
MPCGAATVFMNVTDLESVAHDKNAIARQCQPAMRSPGTTLACAFPPNNKKGSRPFTRSGEPIGAPARSRDRNHAATRWAAMI